MFKTVFVLILILHISTSLYASQTVDGIQIDYEPRFVEDTQSSKNLLSNLPQNIRQVVQSLKVFNGTPSKGISIIRLVNTRYIPEQTVSLDDATTESIKRVSNFDGIKNLKTTIQPKVVSGYDSRRVSIAASLGVSKIGSEVLIIYNHRLNSMLQLMIFFSKELDISQLFSEEDLVDSFNLDKEREYANKLLSSVQVVL